MIILRITCGDLFELEESIERRFRRPVRGDHVMDQALSRVPTRVTGQFDIADRFGAGKLDHDMFATVRAAGPLFLSESMS